MVVFRWGVKTCRKGTAAVHSRYISRQRTNEAQDLIAKSHLHMPSFSNDDPHVLWEAADKHERANDSAAGEFIVSLPKELPEEKNTTLAWRLVHLLANKQPCEFALHKPSGSIPGENTRTCTCRHRIVRLTALIGHQDVGAALFVRHQAIASGLAQQRATWLL